MSSIDIAGQDLTGFKERVKTFCQLRDRAQKLSKEVGKEIQNTEALVIIELANKGEEILAQIENKTEIWIDEMILISGWTEISELVLNSIQEMMEKVLKTKEIDLNIDGYKYKIK